MLLVARSNSVNFNVRSTGGRLLCDYGSVIYYYRDVSAGATGATTVAPKFSDTLTLSQPGGDRFCPPSQRSNLNYPHDYVPALEYSLNQVL